jgi:hypothetical protein
MEEINNAEDMERALSSMTPEQREHLRLLIATLVNCYLSEDRHALVLLGNDKEESVKVVAVNTTDMEAANLLGAVDCYLNFRLLDEAPPKEMMN